MARECLALNTLIFIFAGLQNGQRLDIVEGKSYKHFLSCATMGSIDF